MSELEVKQEVSQEVKPEVDLVSQVSGFKPEVKEEQKIQDSEEKFNSQELQSEIDKIKDPTLKAQIEGLRKSLQRGYNDKFQTIAEMRKDMERQLTETNLWTPEKIQRLLNDQNFVQAAQSVMQAQNPPNSGKSEEEWSTLTDTEKQRILDLQNEIFILKQQNQQNSNAQQDEMLKARYANYNPQLVSKLKDDLINNRVRATNEHLWKVLDYDDGIKRAIEFGRKMERDLKMEKVNNFSYEPGSSSVVKEEKLSKEGEISLSQLYNFNKDKQKESQLR